MILCWSIKFYWKGKPLKKQDKPSTLNMGNEENIRVSAEQIGGEKLWFMKSKNFFLIDWKINDWLKWRFFISDLLIMEKYLFNKFLFLCLNLIDSEYKKGQIRTKTPKSIKGIIIRNLFLYFGVLVNLEV